MSEHHELLEDEGAGYLISVSDMMSGLLLIFIITLVAFIINFQDAIQKQNEVTETRKEVVRKLTNTEQVRNELLQTLKDRLAKEKIEVEIDKHHGVLRLTEKAVLFKTAADTLSDHYTNNLKIISSVLNKVIPCYAGNPPNDFSCTNLSQTRGKIDAIFIEGHTDNVPMRSSRMKDNWELSANRAIAAYRLVVPNSVLEDLRNTSGQPIFSVSGYGEGRPVDGHNHSKPTPDDANRRIDLRFIMTPPALTEPQKALIAKGVK
ncbi:OmpA family protein [Vibrio sp. Vb1554]|uniref:OmpA/MotB family protein n=1 Tax=Vibrio sp. Vb1554 TaxID=3074642 RepID=UPI0029675167|nr:OmpA family protein [Vibrio sp. Vb1554]MDW3048244.1 OmpA family protein [Vibrio sp. Vb1554]